MLLKNLKGGKKIKKFIKISCCALSLAVLFSGFVTLGLSASFPDEVFIEKGESVEVKCPIPLRAESVMNADGESYNLKLTTNAGTLVKNVEIREIEKHRLIPAGIPFGIKMFTKGVMVVGLSDIEKDGRLINPAKDCGIKCGDIILKIDGKEVSSNEDVGKIINSSNGRDVAVTLQKKGQTKTVSLKPAKSSDGYKAGMWVRDSSAGIGTMTFYDPLSDSFGGLGHPVCDVDTGEILPIDHGKAVGVTITGVIKGEKGTPGELRGVFSNLNIGNLYDNRESGIFGKAENIKYTARPVEAASKHEIHEGSAYILTTVEGNSPKPYKIEIEKISMREKNTSKNMIIRITDPALLQKTGGIVQGMSGSPIIQDGKLIGAVTHVFVNDPTRGYGIFIENMIDTTV